MSKEIDINSLKALDLVGGADFLERLCRRLIRQACCSGVPETVEAIQAYCDYHEVTKASLVAPLSGRQIWGKDTWWNRVQEIAPMIGWTLDDMLPRWDFPSPEIEAAWRRKWDLVEKNGPYNSFKGYMQMQFLFEKSEWEHYGFPIGKIDFSAMKALVT